MSDADAAWMRSVAEAVPLGARVVGVVAERHPFGVFVRLDDHPDIRAIVEINNYRPHGSPVPPEGLPPAGARVDAIVVDHVPLNRQVRLRVSSGS